MVYSRGAASARFLLMLAFLSLLIGFEAEPGKAVSWYNVTVKTVGLYQNVGARVYASGHLMGTIYGEGTLSFNTTYGPTVSVDSYVPDGYPYYGYPYYSYQGPFWGPYGHNGVAFFCRANSQTATVNTTVTLTFRYDPLFFLCVKSERGSPEGTGWYLAGSWARISISSPSEESGGTRYRFDKWTGTYLRESANNPVNLVYMDSPKLIEAVWIPQYRLTVNSLYGQVSGGGWYDKDQVATFSVTSPVSGGEGIRHMFNSWSGDYVGTAATGTLTMNGPKTATATWKTQFQLTVDPKGGQVDKTSQWVDSGTSVSVTAISPCNTVERKSRLVFSGWQGATTSTFTTVTLVMDAPKTLTATWKWQYYLIVETKHGTPTGEGWYDTDSFAEFSVPAETPMEPPFDLFGGRYVFAGWTGDSMSSTPKATILMDRAHIVTAQWKSDYSGVTLFFVIIAVIGAVVVVLVAKRDIFKGPREQGTPPRPENTSRTGNRPSRPKILGVLRRKKRKKS